MLFRGHPGAGLFHVINQDSAGHYARAKNQHGGQNNRWNYLPIVHGVASGWSTEASSVFSKSCDKSLLLPAATGVNSEMAPQTAANTTHDTAARHNPRSQRARPEAPARSAMRAVMRFSN